MAKRYRSLRREQKLLRGKICFVDHFYPEMTKPPCDDKATIDFIESRAGFGTQFWVYQGEGADVVVDPDAVPEGMTVGDMEGVARKLQHLGLNVNPDLLKKEVIEEEEEPPVPTLTKIHKSSKADLIKMAESLKWDDIDTTANAVALRESMLEKAKGLMN